jgi:hypothetical protein
MFRQPLLYPHIFHIRKTDGFKRRVPEEAGFCYLAAPCHAAKTFAVPILYGCISYKISLDLHEFLGADACLFQRSMQRAGLDWKTAKSKRS